MTDVADIGPRRISDREVPLVLTGYLMPTREQNVPVLASMPGTDDLFMFVFSSEDKLIASMRELAISYTRVSVVTDGSQLLDEVGATNAAGNRPYRLRIAVDPYKAESGRVRFVEPLSFEESR